MATRYCGEVKINIKLVETTLIPSEMYKCSLSVKGKSRGVEYVGVPAYLTHAIDSPKAYDDAAHAAISFALDEGKVTENDCWFTPSGNDIRRRKGRI